MDVTEPVYMHANKPIIIWFPSSPSVSFMMLLPTQLFACPTLASTCGIGGELSTLTPIICMLKNIFAGNGSLDLNLH